MSTMFAINFASSLLIHQSIEKNEPQYASCYVKKGINHPIAVTQLTDPDSVRDVGKLFYRINFFGLCISIYNILQAIFCIFAPKSIHHLIKRTTANIKYWIFILFFFCRYAPISGYSIQPMNEIRRKMSIM